jgi:cation diffusion facilitator CzcD-associated flavoprotein CzcO
MIWNAADRRWLIETSRGSFRCRNLVVAAGRLSEPRVPQLPGIDTFPGATFHSARWNPDVSLRGKRVGIVGSGASAVQILPQIVDEAAELVLFQRSAPYVIPRGDHAYAEAERRILARNPALVERLRARLFWEAETRFADRIGDPAKARELALGHLRSQIGDPALVEKLTPSYEFGCKRVLLSDDYYRALAEPHVTVEASALGSIEGSTAIAKNGSRHDLDVLIFATGFHSTQPPFAERIVGAGGLSLSEHWHGGMTAYMSTTVHGFPNLFILNGPNASLGHNSAVFMIESQIDYVLSLLRYREAEQIEVLDVKRDSEEAYVRELDRKSASSVWLTGGCDSWYVDDRSKRLTLLWPDFAYAFRQRLSRVHPADYESSPAAQ